VSTGLAKKRDHFVLRHITLEIRNRRWPLPNLA